MAVESISTSVVVNFGDVGSSQYQASLEVDSRPDGYNNGVTSFNGGDTVGLLLYKSSNVVELSSISSAGSLVKQSGTEAVEVVDEYLVFTDTSEANLSKPVYSGFSYEWLGTSLGSLATTANGTKVKTSTKGVAVAKVSYTTNATQYILSTPATINGSNTYKIACVVFAEVP